MRVPGLAGVRGDDGAELAIGATTTLSAVAADPRSRDRYPAFAEAVESISTPVLRHMGTLGGNLCLDTRCTYYNQNEEWRQAIGYCMKEAGSVCWVAPSSPRCWAIAASDSARDVVRARGTGEPASQQPASGRRPWRRSTATMGSTTSPSGPTRS